MKEKEREGEAEDVTDEYRARGKDGRMEGWREGMGMADGGGRAITAMSSVTDLHRPLHSHSPRLLSMELLSSVAYH